MSSAQPIRILIAALGGEGGGVLAGWIANAAVANGHFGQRTSIPGVAQRTGATTYYLEILPNEGSTAGKRKPVLALNAAPGEVDVMIASELLETVRAIQAGYVSADRTVLIASKSRVFTVDEKSAMGDGRLDPDRLEAVARKFAKQALIVDFAAIAAAEQCQPNAVLLGALAGLGVLPISVRDFQAAVEIEGKSVKSNLRGFQAGVALAAAEREPVQEEIIEEIIASAAGEPDVELRARIVLPVVAEAVALEGVRRLVDYQGTDYANLYLDRLERFVDKPGVDGPLIRELARHLAVRMSFEDTIRVAQLKLREGRVDRLRQESKAGGRDIIDVTEFLKPGPEEIFSLLSPKMGRGVLRFLGWIGWKEKSFPMRVQTTRFGGFLRLKLLSKLRGRRPKTLRYADEQEWIENWLSLVERTLAMDVNAAREVVETARLVKGYGDTYKRGHTNWDRIAKEVVEPFLAGDMPGSQFADAVLQTRLAALADPDGARLGAVIEAVRALPAERRIAAE
jgi:indolepyruvate ferredoxin oxidoreductase beta subunit